MEKMKTTIKERQQAFTIIEVIVTTGVLSIFLFGFIQTYIVLESQRVNVALRARASDIAYTNLHKVTSRPVQLTKQVCTTNKNQMDLTTSKATQYNKTGLDLTPYGYNLESDADVKKSLGPNASQSLVAFAPAGCANLDSFPVKILSTVAYGTNGDAISHANFVK